MVPGLPGTARSRDRATAQTTRQGREGKGREGRKKGKERGRERESKRSIGGREDVGEGNIRSEIVAWTSVFAVCFIDRTW
jgi:hypothetical protein